VSSKPAGPQLAAIGYMRHIFMQMTHYISAAPSGISSIALASFEFHPYKNYVLDGG